MDGKIIRNKLVGSEDERAVSPVIGVILMVAITVILAAVIAAFVLDIGDDMGQGSVNAVVSTDVSQNDNTTTFTLTETGDAERFVIRGDVVDTYTDSDDHGTEDGDLVIEDHDPDNDANEVRLDFNDVSTGATHTLEHNPGESDWGDEDEDNILGKTGEVNIIAIDGSSESVIGSVDWDYSED
ncbi:type IV pilin [Natronorubrum sp. DTA28]|uniref:type IV pilin n=1 Tax=Natronorubrum sp. DTA28 TaxID=3447019 RepID=UPI003F87AD0C